MEVGDYFDLLSVPPAESMGGDLSALMHDSTKASVRSEIG
jgi:hypothetical protein